MGSFQKPSPSVGPSEEQLARDLPPHSHGPLLAQIGATADGRAHRLESPPYTAEANAAMTGKAQPSTSYRRTVTGPPPPGGPMTLLDAYHGVQARDGSGITTLWRAQANRRAGNRVTAARVR